MGVSSRAVVVVYVNHRFVGQFSWGEYSTGIFVSAAVDPVAAKAVQVNGQRKHDQTLRLELDCNLRGMPFEIATAGRENRWNRTSESCATFVSIFRTRPSLERKTKLILPSIVRVEPSAMRSFKLHFL